MKKHISLKSYIIITILALVFCSLVVVFFASYTLVRERLAQNMLRNITQYTDSVALYIEAEDSGSYMEGMILFDVFDHFPWPGHLHQFQLILNKYFYLPINLLTDAF